MSVADIRLRGEGNLECGNGSLSSATVTSYQNKLSYWHGLTASQQWVLTWTADFEDGIGEITGTASRIYSGFEETRTLSGHIVLDPTSLCDASTASPALVEIVLE